MADKRIKKPRNLEGAAKYVGKAGDIELKIEDLKQRLNEKKKALQSPFDRRAKKLVEDMEQIVENLYRFFIDNQDKIASDKRSVTVATGTFGLKSNPPYVDIEDEKKAFKELKKKGLYTRFVRRKVEYVIDREALLKEPKTVKRLKTIDIKQDEVFFVKPKKAKLNIEPKKLGHIKIS